MSALSIVHIGDEPTTSSDNIVVEKSFDDKNIEKNGRNGKVKQRNYTLNDVAALKKKMKAEVKKQEVSIGKEAKDASNITVPMKASFFEFVKAYFINDLIDNSNIVKIDNAEGVKAATDNHGDAFVEYLMEITFKVNKHVHCVKLTAYTTTSQLVFQPVGEKSGPKEHLGQKGSPRFFVENFLLPWCSKAISEKRYNEDIATKYYNALKEEIRKLDIMKLDQKKASKNISIEIDSMSKPGAKCAAKACNFKGIDPQNKAAVGVCAKCGNIEHFACVKIKNDHKEDIVRGIQKYFCSSCFTSNPSLILPDTSPPVKARARLDSLPLMGQGYLKITHSTTAKAILANQNQEMKKCDICDYETKSVQELRTHIDIVHKPECDKCKKTFNTAEELSKHIDTEHDVQGINEYIQNVDKHTCQHCDKMLGSSEELKDHVDSQHKLPCPSLSLDKQAQSKENHPCGDCDELFPNRNSLDKHVSEHHEFQCTHCEFVKNTRAALEEHIRESHTFLCVVCNISFPTEKDSNTHNETVHRPKDRTYECFSCEIIFSTPELMRKHTQEEHMHGCEVCNNKYKTKSLLNEHIATHTHTTPFKCQHCDQIIENRTELKTHIQTNHTFDCETCGYVGIGEGNMEDHILEKHAQPDSNGMYSCNDGTFQSREKFLVIISK